MPMRGLWDNAEVLRTTVAMIPELWAEVPRGHYSKLTGALHNILNFCETLHGPLALGSLVSILAQTLFFFFFDDVISLQKWVFLSCYNKKQVPYEDLCGIENEGVGVWFRSFAVPNKHIHPIGDCV